MAADAAAERRAAGAQAALAAELRGLVEEGVSGVASSAAAAVAAEANDRRAALRAAATRWDWQAAEAEVAAAVAERLGFAVDLVAERGAAAAADDALNLAASRAAASRRVVAAKVEAVAVQARGVAARLDEEEVRARAAH